MEFQAFCAQQLQGKRYILGSQVVLFFNHWIKVKISVHSNCSKASWNFYQGLYRNFMQEVRLQLIEQLIIQNRRLTCDEICNCVARVTDCTSLRYEILSVIMASTRRHDARMWAPLCDYVSAYYAWDSIYRRQRVTLFGSCFEELFHVPCRENKLTVVFSIDAATSSHSMMKGKAMCMGMLLVTVKHYRIYL